MKRKIIWFLSNALLWLFLALCIGYPMRDTYREQLAKIQVERIERRKKFWAGVREHAEAFLIAVAVVIPCVAIGLAIHTLFDLSARVTKLEQTPIRRVDPETVKLLMWEQYGIPMPWAIWTNQPYAK